MKILSILLALYTLSSLIPVLDSPLWQIRMMDFPRLQAFTLGIIVFIPVMIRAIKAKKRIYLLQLITIVAFGFDANRIYPYSPLIRIESQMHASHPGEFKILTYNVLQTNKEKGKLLALIKEKNPDMIFLYEVDKKWTDSLSSLPGYPFRKLDPMDNTYGIAFLSKRPVDSIEMKFRVTNDIPSYVIKFKGITIFVVHPRPPKPPVDSDKRDAELVLVAKEAKQTDGPVLVIGDMNDVAWSHTTRLFRRISGLLDPRVGRHPFGTFPSTNILLRWPLDYIFHSEELKLTGIDVLPDVGSNHLPLEASFYVSRKGEQKSTEVPKEGDAKEARKIIRKGTSGN